MRAMVDIALLKGIEKYIYGSMVSRIGEKSRNR